MNEYEYQQALSEAAAALNRAASKAPKNDKSIINAALDSLIPLSMRNLRKLGEMPEVRQRIAREMRAS